MNEIAARIADARIADARPKLLMPDLTEFSHVALYFSREPSWVPERWPYIHGSTKYFSVSGSPAYPAPAAHCYVDVGGSFLSRLAPHIVQDPQNRVTLRLIRWSEDAALLLAQNSLILGGPWLSFLDPHTVPMPGWGFPADVVLS